MKKEGICFSLIENANKYIHSSLSLYPVIFFSFLEFFVSLFKRKNKLKEARTIIKYTSKKQKSN